MNLYEKTKRGVEKMSNFEKLNAILKAMRNKGIGGIMEYYVYLYIVENPNSTNKEIANATEINFSQLRNILSSLKKKGLIDSVDDKNDMTHNQLKRQLYFSV